MSIDEMKLEAINKVIRLQSENSLQEVLKHLNKLNNSDVINLSQHYNVVKEQYEDVLKKLAQ